MGNVIPVLINTDCLHDVVGDQLLDDIRLLSGGRSRTDWGHDYYNDGRMSGIALEGRNGVKVAPYSHSSETHLFMTEHTNLVEMNSTCSRWRAAESAELATKELARIKQAQAMLKQAEKDVKALISKHAETPVS